MKVPAGPTFLERSRPFSKPFFRLGITLIGFVLWVALQGVLFDVFGFVKNGILNYGISGFLALVVIIPFWKLVPDTAGRFGRRNGSVAVASVFVLIVPFVVVALMIGLEYVGITSEWSIFAIALFLLAAAEEVICRGFMMDALSFRKSSLTGLLLSSVVFAMLHIGNSYASFAGIANIFLAGALFGLMRLVTEGLFFPILLHWFWNLLTGMIFGWNVSGHELLPTVFRPLGNPPWGSFGPEESILMTIGTMGAIALLVKELYSPDEKDTSRYL